MQEIHNGSTQTLQITILKNGVESAADGAVSVSIYDVSSVNASSSALVTGTASATGSQGVYEYSITPTLTSLNRVIRTDYSYTSILILRSNLLAALFTLLLIVNVRRETAI